MLAAGGRCCVVIFDGVDAEWIEVRQARFKNFGTRGVDSTDDEKEKKK